MRTEWALQAVGLTKYYSGSCVVDHLNLNIPRGKLFGILGPNGAGKSTTLRMIQGVTPPDSGKLQVLGYPIPQSAAQMRFRMGVVPQIDNLDPDFTVIENLRVYGSYFGIDRRVLDQRIDELLGFVELQGLEDSHIHSLSGGMQRRLTFARALINDPDLVILDEPTTGLDPQVRHQIWNKLRELIQQGKTLLLTTHYMEEAQRLCHEMVIIDHGRIIQQGVPKDLIRDHVEPEVIEVHDDERVLDIFKSVFGCRVESAGGSIYGYLKNVEQVIPLLQESNIAYLHRPANLEDVFLKLTGHGLRS